MASEYDNRARLSRSPTTSFQLDHASSDADKPNSHYSRALNPLREGRERCQRSVIRSSPESRPPGIAPATNLFQAPRHRTARRLLCLGAASTCTRSNRRRRDVHSSPRSRRPLVVRSQDLHQRTRSEASRPPDPPQTRRQAGGCVVPGCQWRRYHLPTGQLYCRAAHVTRPWLITYHVSHRPSKVPVPGPRLGIPGPSPHSWMFCVTCCIP